SPPSAFLIARSMLSFGMFSCRAATMAARSRGFMAGSGVQRLAATVISRASLPNSFDFWASCRPLRCMMFLNWEWPAMRGLLESSSSEGGKRGLIGRQPAEIKDLGVVLGTCLVRLLEYEAVVNHDFMPG